MHVERPLRGPYPWLYLFDHFAVVTATYTYRPHLPSLSMLDLQTGWQALAKHSFLLSTIQ